jgi:bifunctional UDP-N-acetylglucosamine pyrophosphorylase/glucosamine-1-phosphate N-acetyltransferase
MRQAGRRIKLAPISFLPTIMASTPLNVVILAAGKGKRMRSDLPKVLHPIAGKAMLAHVVDAARQLGAARICVVYGHGGEIVPQTMAAPDLVFAKQDPQLGTGHAVLQAMPQLDPALPTLVLYGDVPLTRVATLRRLIDEAGRDAMALLTVSMDNPHRLWPHPARWRRQGHPHRRREGRHADERQINEVNTGILAAPVRACASGWVTRQRQRPGRVLPHRHHRHGGGRRPGRAHHPARRLRGNPRRQQQDPTRRTRTHPSAQHRPRLTDAGVTVIDPARIDVRGELECGRDVEIDINCIFRRHAWNWATVCASAPTAC